MPKLLTTKQQYWTDHLERAESFDGSLADYARAEGLAVQSLYRWRHSLNRFTDESISQEKTTFTQVISTALSQPMSLTLVIGHTQLRFNRLPDAAWLAQLISATHRS